MEGRGEGRHAILFDYSVGFKEVEKLNGVRNSSFQFL